MDWHELEKMKVTALREMAKEKANVTGASGMHKADLVELLAQTLGIEKPHKIAVGAEKFELKKQIRELKAKREAALGSKDKAGLNRIRRQIHKLRRKLRAHAKLAG